VKSFYLHFLIGDYNSLDERLVVIDILFYFIIMQFN